MAKDRKAFELICKDIATSSEGLRYLCKKHDVNIQTFYNWMNEDAALLELYARAKDVQTELMIEDILTIADDSSQDELITEFGVQENREFVSRSKLRVEARKWIAAKLKPKKYGDKVDVEHSGKIEIDFKDAE